MYSEDELFDLTSAQAPAKRLSRMAMLDAGDGGNEEDPPRLAVGLSLS